ncbi:MAG: hypothetical protein KZQ95_07965 [Candidatus Thiodiazotropha sp. (ex Epidulcina cf. delphinae)]|nr:hypothetical protein [Candidatus Thiodiazotropha sp. (ex Epidulcina cf. delphinae)]
MDQHSISSIVSPIIHSLPDNPLRDALTEGFHQSKSQLESIESGFKRFADKRWSPMMTCTFMKSWHSTHLKMLPIYGLTCRLHRLAKTADGTARDHYFMAAARNAETSHEDLNLDGRFELNHAQLYDEMANALCNGDAWYSEQYNLPEAAEFKVWIRDNMIEQDLSIGLLTNMFSEIFNHGEYTYALEHFNNIFSQHYGYDNHQCQRLSIYIKCHVTSDVEVDHFHCCIDALDHANQAQGFSMDPTMVHAVSTEYLDRMSRIMGSLVRLMDDEDA